MGPDPTDDHRSRLLAMLDDRLNRFVGDERAALDGPDALALARALATGSVADLAVTYSLGLFHHYRLIANLPALDGVDDAAAALGHFGTLFRQAPDLVPEAVREIVARGWTASAEDVETWRIRATNLQQDPRRFALPDLYADAVYLLDLVLGSGQLAPEHISPTLGQLTMAYVGGYEATGDTTLLDGAVDAATRCVAATGPDDAHLAGRRSNLAATLASRFNHSGATGDLDRAIGEFWAAVDGATDAERPGYLSNLGSALMLRFTMSGDTVSLNQAVHCGQRAVEESAPDDRNRTRMLVALALAARTRFQRVGQPADIDHAVRLLREAVDATAPGHPDRAGQLSALSTALRVRFAATGNRDDIDAAVAAGRAATDAATGPPGVRLRCLSNLGAALSARYRATDDPAELDAAVDAQRAAADLAQPDDPVRATVLANLGLALRRRAGQGAAGTSSRQEADTRAAVRAYADSAAVETAPSLVRAMSSYDAAVLTVETGDWAAATVHFELAIGMLSATVDHQLQHDDRQHGLSRLTGLGPEAAAAALRAGASPETALRLLERARGVLLAQAFAQQTELADLRRHHPDLADRFDNLGRALAAAAEVTGDLANARLRRRREQERGRLLGQIRSMPGFDRFLEPVDRPLPAGLPGVTVAVNVARAGCDALVVIDGRVTRLALEKLSYDEARTRANAVLSAIADDDWTTNDRVRVVLGWAWDTIMRPILDHLDERKALAGSQTRVWWIPTGPLTVIPLHAAMSTDPSGGSVLDRVVSSYAATINTLVRDTVPTHRATSLVVAVPDAPGHTALAAAEREARWVAARLAETGYPPHPPIIGAAATRAEVLARLSTAGWAHFACHATAADNPADSHLVLHDGPLPVRELFSLRVEGAFLAYLSACTTAFGGTDLVDEAIHISSAFQLAGYRHVIGTLWQVGDEVADLVARAVYGEITGSPALAVHLTVLRLRERYPDNPRVWAAYLHVGD
ncbi:CHAT domain-containing protein [Micromonospora sp. NPDC049523]|uniref:CHAT domain-containing protein n=1 Tax=Micromonospora sp. NPDC049523 TaxID=3155921 RepID=UPI003432972D